MNDSTVLGMIAGVIIGAVTVSMCKPAQKLVKKGADAIKEEAMNLANKKNGE